MNVRKSPLNVLVKALSFQRGLMTAVCLIIALSLSGCALIQLKKEHTEGLYSTALVGRITTEFPGKGPIIVTAYSVKRGKKEVGHYTVLHDYGEYELMVAKGNYYIFAFWDKNSNLIYDVGEPAGQFGDPETVTAPAGGVVGNLDIEIPEKAQKIAVPFGFEVSPIKPKQFHSRLAGAIVDLDDERFSPEQGSRGYWEPSSFFRELGGNIYFLEEYDPRKIPILFIHGASGTPREWKDFVAGIDRSRFQPWFFYYPSGSRIQSMSHLLYWKLLNLKMKYDFDQLYITAHSMGGLVARSFIMDHSAHFPYVKLFISLATPWGGAGMAEYGVEQSPAVVPCWIDMQSDGPFIQSLYREAMPETVSFYMFYGHRGNRNPFRSNNDSAIEFASLLDRRAQSEAKMNYAFNEDHVSIIHSKEVLEQYNTVINSYHEKSGGYIDLHFSYNYPEGGKLPSPFLLLQPVGRENGEIVIDLLAKDSGRKLGPFPPGDYLASLGALTAVGDSYVPVTIEDNDVTELSFILFPDNVICGTLISDMLTKDWEVGMPYAENFVIESIRLQGSGIHKVLPLLAGDDVNIYDYRVTRADNYYKGNFIFYGLSPGKYQLTIRVRGHQPFVKKCVIEAGKPFDPLLVELTPLN